MSDSKFPYPNEALYTVTSEFTRWARAEFEATSHTGDINKALHLCRRGYLLCKEHMKAELTAARAEKEKWLDACHREQILRKELEAKLQAADEELVELNEWKQRARIAEEENAKFRERVKGLEAEILWFQEQAKPHGGTLAVYSKIEALEAKLTLATEALERAKHRFDDLVPHDNSVEDHAMRGVNEIDQALARIKDSDSGVVLNEESSAERRDSSESRSEEG